MEDSERTRFLQDIGPIQDSARRCIHCGFCNAVCPTSNVLTAFKESRTSRGRVVMLQSFVEGVGALNPYEPDFKELIDLCYSCRRCVETCPAGIPIPDLMSRARYAYHRRAGPGGLTLGHRIYANYGNFDRIASAVAPLSNYALRRRSVRALIQRLTHIDARARLPRFHVETFESWFRKQPVRQHEKKAVYFMDSYANYNDPSLGKTVATLLDRLGYQVIVPLQRESGMPAIEYGMLDKARKLALYNVGSLASYARDGLPIVCSSPAATYLLREGYGDLIEGGEESLVSEAVIDMSELMADELDRGRLNFEEAPSQKAVYHYCCLSKALKLGPTTRRLLNAAGIDHRVVEDCCGGAGVWGTFKENYDLSSEIADKLGQKVEPEDVILTESETCRLQAEAHLGDRVRFPLELLAPRVSDR